MFKLLKSIYSIQGLYTKILFTLKMLVICRIGAYVSVPAINGEEVVKVFRFALGGGGNLFQLMDVFSGGAFAKMTVVALGVMPYISASIIMQLIIVLVPSLQREMKESPTQTQRKTGQWTRMLTMFLAVFQSIIFARQAVSMNISNRGIIVENILSVTLFGVSWLFYITVVLSMITGTLFLMWVGEQITSKGIGNGISLIITVGILSSLPSTVGMLIKQLNLDSQETGQLSFVSLTMLSVLFLLIVMGTILVVQGVRKIPLQYARRGTAYSMSDSYIPLKINHAGVIPVIFASSCLMFPATIAQFISNGEWTRKVVLFLSPGSWSYMLIFVTLIMCFTYFWTITQFRSDQIISDMKKNGAFVPGIRQGGPTKEYLESVIYRITFLGGLCLSCIAILPTLVGKLLGVDPYISNFFGGTTLLILVGVVLDTSKQLEVQIKMKNYGGFMRSGNG